MAFMGGSRLALLRAAREQAESNQNRAERGGAGLRQAILDYGSETRANTYADIAKQQEGRAKEKWALEQEKYAMQKQALEEAKRKAAAEKALQDQFTEAIAADKRWQFTPKHPDHNQKPHPSSGTPDSAYLLDEGTGENILADGAPTAEMPGPPSALSGKVSGGNLHMGGTQIGGEMSRIPEAGPGSEIHDFSKFHQAVKDKEPRDLTEMTNRIMAKMQAAGYEVSRGEVLRMAMEKDKELSKAQFDHEDHLGEDRRKQLVLQEKMTEHEIDKLNIEKLRDQLVNDLPKNIGAFYVRNEGLFRDAIQPHTGPGEDTRDPKMLALAKVIRTQLGIDRTDPNYENVMTNEFSTRMKLVTDDLAKKKTVKGSEAIASYIMNGMRKKPDEEKAKQYKMADSAAKGMAMRNQTLEKAVNFTQRLEQMTGGTPNASSKIKSFKEELLGYLDMQGVEFTTMEALSEDVLAGFMREVSGLTVNEGEAKRLKKVLPGMDKNPEAVLAAWYEFIDRAYDQHMDLIEIYEDEGQMREGDKWRQKVKWEKGRGKKKSQLIQGQAILRDKEVIVMMPPLGSEEEVAYVDDVDDLKALIVKGYIVAGRK